MAVGSTPKIVDPTIRVFAPSAQIANAPANLADQKTQQVSKGFFSSLASFIGKLLFAVTFPVSIPLLFLISKIHNALSSSKPSVTTTELPLTQRNNDLAIQTLTPRVNSAVDNAQAAPVSLAIEAAPVPLAIEAPPVPLAIEAPPVPLAIEAAPVPLAIEAAPDFSEEFETTTLKSAFKILAGSLGTSLVGMNVISAFMTASPLVSNFTNSTSH